MSGALPGWAAGKARLRIVLGVVGCDKPAGEQGRDPALYGQVDLRPHRLEESGGSIDGVRDVLIVAEQKGLPGCFGIAAQEGAALPRLHHPNHGSGGDFGRGQGRGASCRIERHAGLLRHLHRVRVRQDAVAAIHAARNDGGPASHGIQVVLQQRFRHRAAAQVARAHHD